MGLPDHLTWLLRNLYAGQEATVRTVHGTTDWFQIGKGVHQGYILSPCLFNLYAEYIMRNAGLEEVQAGIKIARRNINNLRYTDDTTLMAESEDELNSHESERGEWKSWLQAQHTENEDHGKWFRKRRTWQLFPSLHGKLMGKQCQTLFWGAPESLQFITAMKSKDAYYLEGKLWPTLIPYAKAETLHCQQRST